LDQSISKVYEDYIWKNEYTSLAGKLYNDPPKSLQQVVERIPALLEKYNETEWFDEVKARRLKEALHSANSKISALTPKVCQNIDRISIGGIEAAHQSVAMGGSCYILNKAATASIIARLAQDAGQNITPFYFIADYDIVQSELTNIRTPIMGQGGNLVSIPIPEGYAYSPVSKIPLPSNDWYLEVEESIRSNYNPLLKILDGTAKKLYEERMEHALSITRWAFYNSSTLDEWAVSIMGRLMNVEGDLGIPLIPTSNKEIRKLLIEGMEFLLSAENREVFIQTHAESTSLIKENGFIPGSGERSRDYVPFYYECPEKGCNRSRTELAYKREGNKTILHGKCPSCSQSIEIETSADQPNLEDHAEFLSPRVDSRQIILNRVLPVLVHVGGAGETAYYAQVIPTAEALSIPFPMFVKYPRVYFNTPYNERLAETLTKKNIPVLHQSEMFKYMGKANKAKRKNRPDEMNEAWYGFKNFLNQTHKQINEKHKEILSELDTPEGKRDNELIITRLELERYLSWTFGQYVEDKMGQESSWSWIEWGINAGLQDLFGPYERAYVSSLKNGATIFINFVV